MSEMNFNPSSAAVMDSGLFGLPFDENQSLIIIIPVPWELTVSYGKGAASGPKAIREASMQIDLYNHNYPELWKKGIWLDQFPDELSMLHIELRHQADAIIEAIEQGIDVETLPEFQQRYEQINAGTEKMQAWLFERIHFWRSQNKVVGLLGGDHSIPLAFHRLLSAEQEHYGILMVDAHLDLRNAYEGFRFSHASIFYNALQMNTVEKLVQVGIRDYCHEEVQFVRSNTERIKVFFDRDLRNEQYEGKRWQQQVDEMLALLPEKVYVSIDIDGLDPTLCPNTGTPVPGGLQYEELMYLLNRLFAANKEIVGFDLCEVSPGADGQWDGNVGARVLFQLCGLASRSSR